MAHLTLCDRCYAKISGPPNSLTLIPSKTGLTGGDRWDLCLDCRVHFDEWMANATKSSNVAQLLE